MCMMFFLHDTWFGKWVTMLFIWMVGEFWLVLVTTHETFLGIQEFDGFGAQHEPKCQSTRTQKVPQSQSS